MSSIDYRALGHWLSHPTLWKAAALIGACTLVLVAYEQAERLGHRRRDRRGAHWATRRDLATLVVRAPGKGRLILGRYGNRLVAASDRQSTLVIGPTQHGKTAGLVIPGIIEWQGPVVSTSVKRDVYAATIEAREELGEVKVFDPLGRTGVPSAAWSPIAESATWPRARATAALLMQTGWEQEKADREPHWRKEAARHLAPLLLAAHQGRCNLGDVLDWINRDRPDDPNSLVRLEIKGYLQRLGKQGEAALLNLENTWSKNARYQDSVISTITAQMDPWQEPSVVQATDRPDITAEWLISGNNTLYIIASERDQRRLAGMVAALVQQLIADAFDLAMSHPGQRLDPPVLVALDECANIAPIPNLAEIASTGIGPGILLLSVFQDYAQARERFGADRASSIFAQHTCKVLTSGIADPDTLDYVRRLLGDEIVEQASRTHNRGGGATTTSPHHQPLVPPVRIRQAQPDSALLVAGRIPPAWIRLRPYYSDRPMLANTNTRKQPATTGGRAP